jgi:hypothetical protein
MQVEQAVPGDPGVHARVDPDLDLPQRTVAGRQGEVGDPDVVPRRRTGRRGHHQPPAVPGHRDVVVVRGVEAGAVNLHVGRRVGSDPVPPHPPVELVLAVGHRIRRQPPHVVELVATGQPGDGGVAAAIDRPLQPLAGGDVEHEEHRLLVAAGGQLVGEAIALLARLRRIERRRAGRVERARVDQDALRPVRLHD